MADIEQRLREFGREGFPVALEAADTIATLRQEAEALRGQVEALRASVAAIHCRAKFGGHIDASATYALVSECERAVPELAAIDAALSTAQQEPTE